MRQPKHNYAIRATMGTIYVYLWANTNWQTGKLEVLWTPSIDQQTLAAARSWAKSARALDAAVAMGIDPKTIKIVKVG